jgi:hypothetical protein
VRSSDAMACGAVTIGALTGPRQGLGSRSSTKNLSTHGDTRDRSGYHIAHGQIIRLNSRLAAEIGRNQRLSFLHRKSALGVRYQEIAEAAHANTQTDGRLEPEQLLHVPH